MNFFQGISSRHLRRGRRGVSEEGKARNTTAGEPTAELPTAAGTTEVPTAAGADEIPGGGEPGPKEVRRLGEAVGELWKST